MGYLRLLLSLAFAVSVSLVTSQLRAADGNPGCIDAVRALLRQAREPAAAAKPKWVLNTSNPGKRREFAGFFGASSQQVEFTSVDLKEIEASPLQVVAHKASQFSQPGTRVLVEDTSLEIEGAAVGVNVRWLLDDLPKYVGRRAKWRVLIAYREGEFVRVYSGLVEGTIVQPSGAVGAGFGFDSVFRPDGQTKTLAELKPDSVNARAIAVKNLLDNRNPSTVPAITEWHGKWQHD